MDKSELVAIRDFVEGDKNFIYSTWLLGLYYGCSWFTEIKKNTFMASYHQILDNLIPHSQIKVACLKDEPDVILGYSVSHKVQLDTVHWVFVKSAWRKIGIAKSLVATDNILATHMTKIGLEILKAHPQMEFNPFKLN